MSKRTARSPAATAADASADALAADREFKRKNRQRTPTWAARAASEASSAATGPDDARDILSSNQRAFAARFSATSPQGTDPAAPLEADHDFLQDFDFDDALAEGADEPHRDKEDGRAGPPSIAPEAASARSKPRRGKDAVHGARKTKRHAGGGRWTKEEDRRLREAIRRIGTDSWEAIALAVGNGRSDAQCAHRWLKVLEPGLVKGPWTKAEDDMIRQCIEEGVMKWSEIAERIPGRIGKQCRERWFNHLDPTLKKGGWTEEEDALLVEAQSKWGNSWTKIARLLPGRSENAVKNRWNSATRRRAKQQQAGAGPHAGESARARAAITVRTAEKSGILDEATTNIHPGAIRAEQLAREGRLLSNTPPAGLVKRLRGDVRKTLKKSAESPTGRAKGRATGAAVTAASSRSPGLSGGAGFSPASAADRPLSPPATLHQPVRAPRRRGTRSRRKAQQLRDMIEGRGLWREFDVCASFSESAIPSGAPASSAAPFFGHLQEAPLSLSSSLMHLSLDADVDTAMLLDTGISCTPKASDGLRSPLRAFLTKEAHAGDTGLSPTPGRQHVQRGSATGGKGAAAERRARPRLTLDIGQIDSGAGPLPSPASSRLTKVLRRLATDAHAVAEDEKDEAEAARRELASLLDSRASPDRLARTLLSRGVDLRSPRMGRALAGTGLSPCTAKLRRLAAAQQAVLAEPSPSESAAERACRGPESPSTDTGPSSGTASPSSSPLGPGAREGPAPARLLIDSVDLLDSQLETSRELADFVQSPNLLWSIESPAFDEHGSLASVAAT